MPVYKSMEEFLADDSTNVSPAGGFDKEDNLRARRWDPSNDSNLVMDAGRGVVRGAISLADSVVGLADVGYNALTGDTLRDGAERLGWRPNEWIEELNAHDSFATQDARREYDNADGFFESAGAIITNPRLLAAMGAEQIPQLLPMVGAAGKAAAMANKAKWGADGVRRAAIAAGSAAEGALTTGSVGAAIGDEYAKQGITNDRRLAGAALGAGAGTALIGAAMGPLGGAVEASIGSRLAGQGFENAMGKTVPRRVAKSIAGEGVEEMLQSGQEQAWQNYGTGHPLDEDLGKSMGTGLVLGGAMGGALHPFTGSAKSQQNLMEGANATAAEKKSAEDAIDKVNTIQDTIAQARADQQAAYEQAQIEEALAQQGQLGGIQETIEQARAEAIPTNPMDMQQGVGQTVADQPIQAQQPVEPQKPRNVVEMSRQNLGMTFTGMVDVANKQIDLGGGKQRIGDIYQSLSDNQKLFVAGMLAARQRVGDNATLKDYLANLTEALDAAVNYVTSDDPAELLSVANTIVPEGKRGRHDADFKIELANIFDEHTQDPKLQGLPLEQRIMAAAHDRRPVTDTKDKKGKKTEAIPTQAPTEAPVEQAAEAPATDKKAEAIPTTSANVLDAETEQAFMDGPDVVTTDTKKARDKKAATQAEIDKAKQSTREMAKEADADEDTKTFIDSLDMGAFSKSKRNKPAKDGDPLLVEVAEREYSEEEAKADRKSTRRLSKAEATTLVNEDDTLEGERARDIVTGIMDDSYDGDIRTGLQFLYNGLSASSLRAAHKRMYGELKRRYTSHGKATPLDKRWVTNVLDEMVTHKEKGEDYTVPDMPQSVRSFAEQNERFDSFGIASDFMDKPGDTTVETFGLKYDSEGEVSAKPITLDEIRKHGVRYDRAVRLKRRMDNTLRMLAERKMRVMVPADSDSNFGASDDSGKAAPLIKLSKASSTGSTQKADGWKALLHDDTTPVTSAEERAVVITVFRKMLDSFDKINTESSSTIPEALRNFFPTSMDEQGKVADNMTRDSNDSDDKDKSTLSTTAQRERKLTMRPVEQKIGKVWDADLLAKGLDDALGTLASDAKNRSTSSVKLAVDFMNIIPMLLRSKLATMKFNKHNPIHKFISASPTNDEVTVEYTGEGKDKKGEIKSPEMIAGADSLLSGFIGAGMYKYYRDLPNATDADKLDAVSTTSTEDSVTVNNVWKETARDIGRMVANLNRSKEDKSYIAKQLVNFVDKHMLESVKVPEAGASQESQNENAYYTQLLEARLPIIRTFRNTVNGTVSLSGNMTERWYDSKKGAETALSANGGDGLATSNSDAAVALRQQFKDDMIEPNFKETFGKPLSQASDVPLLSRIEFYDSVADNRNTVLSWVSPEDTGDNAKYPNGRYLITLEDAQPENASSITEFDPKGLWMDKWVKASGLFTDEEISNSLKMAMGKKTKTDIGSAKLGQHMAKATNEYSVKVGVPSTRSDVNRAAEDVASEETFAETAPKLKPLREALEASEKNLRSFLATTNSTERRINDRWDSFVDALQKQCIASAKEDLLTRAATEENPRTAEIEAASQEVLDAQRAAASISVQMLNRSDWGDLRKQYKQKLADHVTDYLKSYRMLYSKELYARAFKELKEKAELRRKLENKGILEMVEKEAAEDILYIQENMNNMSLAEVNELSENGTPTQQQAVWEAEQIVEDIVQYNAYMDVSSTGTGRGALVTLSSAVERVMNNKGVQANPQLFLDALATHLQKSYLGFGEIYNEFARRLHAKECGKLVKRGFMPPKSDTAYWDAADALEEVKSKYANTERTLEQEYEIRKALSLETDLYNKAVEKEASKTFDKEAFKRRRHSLSQSDMVVTFSEAEKLAEVMKLKEFSKLSDAKRGVIARKLKADMSDGAFAKEGGAQGFNWKGLRDHYRGTPNYSFRAIMDGMSGLDRSYIYAVRKLRSNLAAIVGDERAEAMLNGLTFKQFDDYADVQDADGLFICMDGKKLIFLRPRNANIAIVAAHEFTHSVFGVGATGAHNTHAMTMEVGADGQVKPIGVIATEIFDLAKAVPALNDLLNLYPLDSGITDSNEMQMEVLAQVGALWISDANFRNQVANRAPNLDRMIKSYFIGDNNGPKQLRPSLGKLGQKDTRRESSSGQRVPQGTRKTDRGGQSQLAEPLSSGRGTRQVAGRQRTGVDHEVQEKVEAALYKAADRVSPTDKLTQSVLNRIPLKHRDFVKKVASAAKGYFNEYVAETFMGGLFTEDLAKLVRKAMPSVDRWLSVAKRRDAWINERQHGLTELKNVFDGFSKETQGAFNQLLANVTLEGVWLKRPEWMTAEAWDHHKGNEEVQAMRAQLLESYEALPVEAQRLFDAVLDYGHYSQVLREELMGKKVAEFKKLLEDPSISEEEKQEHRESLEEILMVAQTDVKTYHKPYAPLLREGSHAVVAISDELQKLMEERDQLRQKRRESKDFDESDETQLGILGRKISKMKQAPEHYYVSFVDGEAKANLLADELKKSFKGKVEPFPRENITQHQGFNLETIKKLEDQLVKELNTEEDKAQARQNLRSMVRILNEMYTLNLSQYHANKNRLRRMKVAGFDSNMMNSFITNGYRESLFYGNVKFQSELSDAMRDMREESNAENPNVDKATRKRVFNEILKREELNYKYSPSETISRIQRITSVYMLMTSPAFYMQNLTQSFMMTAPYLTKRYAAKDAFDGIYNNTRRMIQAYFNKDYRNGIEIDFDKVPWMSKELRAGLADARSRGLIDIGIAQDFGDLMNKTKFANITDFLSRGARIVEMVNRVGAFSTAFDLRYAEAVKNKEADPVKVATDYACDVVRETHGDYSAMNEPRYFRKGGMGLGFEKLIFQFRKFQLIQLGFMTRLAKDAFAGADPTTKAAARRALSWTLGTHFTMTGLKGTPLVATMSFILNAIFGDEDDTDEDTLRKFIGNKAVADLLIRGVPAYLGVDVSERVGAGNMFSPFPYLNVNPTSGREGALELIATATGPWASQLVRGFTGLSYMAEGDMYKGLEMMVPNGLTNAMRGIRYATEGVTTRNGTVVIPANEFSGIEAFFQGLGLQTTTMSDRYRLQDKLTRTTDRYSREEAKLYKEYLGASGADRMRVRREWVALQKERAKAGFRGKPVTQLEKHAQKIRKDEKKVVGGLVTNNSNYDFLKYWSKL